MSEIAIEEIHDFDSDQLQELFLSVGWSSGHYPERLAAAMRNFESVSAAWDDNLLIGLR